MCKKLITLLAVLTVLSGCRSTENIEPTFLQKKGNESEVSFESGDALSPVNRTSAVPHSPLAQDEALQSATHSFSNELEVQVSEEKAEGLSAAYEQLKEGAFFYRIPSTAQLNQSFVVEAGLGEILNQAMFDALNIEGPVTVKQGALYDPLQAELVLIDVDGSFAVEPISVGQKPVITNEPVSWKWSVTPLVPGVSTLRIKSLVSLQGAEAPVQSTQAVTGRLVYVPKTFQYQLSKRIASAKYILVPLVSVFLFSILTTYITRSYYARKVVAKTSSQTSGGD